MKEDTTAGAHMHLTVYTRVLGSIVSLSEMAAQPGIHAYTT
jgi:hypothetical protein